MSTKPKRKKLFNILSFNIFLFSISLFLGIGFIFNSLFQSTLQTQNKLKIKEISFQIQNELDKSLLTYQGKAVLLHQLMCEIPDNLLQQFPWKSFHSPLLQSGVLGIFHFIEVNDKTPPCIPVSVVRNNQIQFTFYKNNFQSLNKEFWKISNIGLSEQWGEIIQTSIVENQATIPFYLSTLINSRLKKTCLLLSPGWLNLFCLKLKQKYQTDFFIINKSGSFLALSNTEELGKYQLIDSKCSYLPEKVKEVQNNLLTSQNFSYSSFDFNVICLPLNQGNWYLGCVFPKKEVLGDIEKYQYFVIVLLISGLIGYYYFSRKAAQTISKELSELSEDVEIWSQGDFQHTIKPHNSCLEIGFLSQNVSKMRDFLLAYMHQTIESAKIQEKIEHDIKISRKIQEGFIPSNPFINNQIEIYGVLRPARQVGGDLYDYFIKNNEVYFLLGDVAGKGIPACLFMMMTRILIRSHCEEKSSVSEILTRTNHILAELNPSSHYVTLFMGKINLDSGVLTGCNSGHIPPWFLKNNKIHFWNEQPDICVGMFEETSYSEYQYTLEPGEKIYLFSDGVTEAMNINRELFGDESLEDHILTNTNLSGSDLCSSIIKRLDLHAKNTEQSDDITFMTIQWKGNLDDRKTKS